MTHAFAHHQAFDRQPSKATATAPETLGTHLTLMAVFDNQFLLSHLLNGNDYRWCL